MQIAAAVDFDSIVTKVASSKDVKNLPPGSIVGDQHGGLTFTDAVAAMLESRSAGGWHEIQTPTGQIWTVIVLNR